MSIYPDHIGYFHGLILRTQDTRNFPLEHVCRSICALIWEEIVCNPFINVTCHVINTIWADTVGVCRHVSSRANVIVSIQTFWIHPITPWSTSSVRPPRCLFPLRFGRQTLARPFCIRFCIVPINQGNRVHQSPLIYLAVFPIQRRTMSGRGNKSSV